MRWLFYTAMTCFFLGLLCVIIAVAYPLLTDGSGLLWAYIAAMVLTPLGFILGIAYALLSGIRRTS